MLLGLRGGRLVGEVVVADDAVAGAEGEEELRVRGPDGDDALGPLRDRDRAALEVGNARRERGGAGGWAHGEMERPDGVVAGGAADGEEERDEEREATEHSGSPFLAKVCWPRAGDQATRVRLRQPLRWRDPAGVAPASLGIRVFSCAPDRLRGRGETLLRVAGGVGQVGGEQPLQGHDVGAETVDDEVIALARPFISGEADPMGPVVATEGHVEGLELDPVGLGCVPFRLLDLGDEARVHEFLPLRFRSVFPWGVGEAPASSRV